MMIQSDFIMNENGSLVSKEGLDIKADFFNNDGGKLKVNNEVKYHCKGCAYCIECVG